MIKTYWILAIITMSILLIGAILNLISHLFILLLIEQSLIIEMLEFKELGGINSIFDKK